MTTIPLGEFNQTSQVCLYPQYKVYSGYIVFAFSVIIFVCKLISVKDFSTTTWVRILKFGTKLDSDELYCVTKKKNSHILHISPFTKIAQMVPLGRTTGPTSK